MRAGRLRRRLQLQQRTDGKGALGGVVPTWTTTVTVWGGVEALSGSENFNADQVNSSLQVRIVLRYGSEWSGIDSSWRVQDASTGRKYDIKAVILPEHRSHSRADIELMCFEGETDNG